MCFALCYAGHTHTHTLECLSYLHAAAQTQVIHARKELLPGVCVCVCVCVCEYVCVCVCSHRRALESDAPSGVDVSARIALLSDALLELVLGYVSRSLFNADRLTFGMHLANSLLPHGAVKPEEWAYFLGEHVCVRVCMSHTQTQYVHTSMYT